MRESESPSGTACDTVLSNAPSGWSLDIFISRSATGGDVSAGYGAGPVRLWAVGVLEFGVDASGLGELVFEDDDAARGIERGALVDQFAGPGGEPELVSGVAAVAALRASGGEQLRGVEAAKECLCHAEDLSGVAHAVGRVALVVELPGRVVIGRVLLNRVTPFNGQGPRRREAPGAGAGFTSLFTALLPAAGLVLLPGRRSEMPGPYTLTSTLARHIRLLRYFSAGSSSSPALRELFPCDERNSTTAIPQCLHSPLQKFWSRLTRDFIRGRGKWVPSTSPGGRSADRLARRRRIGTTPPQPVAMGTCRLPR